MSHVIFLIKNFKEPFIRDSAAKSIGTENKSYLKNQLIANMSRKILEFDDDKGKWLKIKRSKI